jgi:putative membrane protein
MSTLFAFLHHVCAFTLVSAVAIEFTLIRQELTLASARRLQVTDMVLGIAAGALLVIGLLRVFFFEKGADYYFHSHAFLAKFLVFIAVGLLSIIPTVEFLSWRAAQRQETETDHRGHSRRTAGHRHHPALRRDHGARRIGLNGS